MNVRTVSFAPTQKALELGRPVLTPELFASIGARYSRNNEGFDSIVAMLKGKDPDKSVDVIFNMLDYGHASIADMVPVALLIEGISLATAYRLWKLSPQGSGQESSTRYLKMSEENFYTPSYFDEKEQKNYDLFITGSFKLYEEGLQYWANILEKHPELLSIPESANQKTRDRMKRNYVFDRARYALPTAAKTNMVLYQSARAWVEVYKWLVTGASSEEEVILAERILDELKILAPRMVKHAKHDQSVEDVAQDELRKRNTIFNQDREDKYEPYLNVSVPTILNVGSNNIPLGLESRANRYSPCGKELTMMSVTYGWTQVAFAEIRDLNRHRTGSKFSTEMPNGVYTASDQSPTPEDSYLQRLYNHLTIWCCIAQLKASQGNADYLMWTNLGTCFDFYHTTTADKFIYTAELRTGLGAGYKYCQHFKDVLALWYSQFPKTKGFILEGSGEPE